jgi:Tfp pilus assembly protein PilN
MIKINLCPIDELESQYWYVPDLAVAAVVAIVSFLGVQYYLGTIQEQIDTTQASIASLKESTERLAPDLVRFKDLQKNVAELNQKLDALKVITVSKISKYKPVIVVEHFQNLKPDGVWFESLRIGADTDPVGFEVKGRAFDNVLTAEFITALRSTESQEPDESDLRTQVYFNGLMLENTQVSDGAPENFPELIGYPEFTIKGRFQERGVMPSMPVQDPDSRISQTSGEGQLEVKF